MTRVVVLGPVMAFAGDGRAVPLGGPKDRAALALLALVPNRVRSEAELVDAIWGDDPPKAASNLLKNQVFRLRRALAATGEGDVHIVTRPGGYELVVEGDQLDLLEVEALVAAAREAATDARHEHAGELLARAAGRFRGVPLADLGDLPFVAAGRQRLEELRLSTLEARIDADLWCARHAELIGELEALTAAEPWRERFWAQRLLALHRAGRQADALRAFQDLRVLLGEELGLLPSRELVALERAVAIGDPSLDWRPSALPSGTVTFLMSDIERSTQLFHRLGPGYEAVLADHDRIVRAVVARHGGVEASHEGDRFLVAFAAAAAAVEAALELQCEIQRHPWPVPMGVRVGLHTGQAEPSGQAYVALPVHQVGRLCAAGHAGQVLLSQATAGGVARLPHGASLLDLGPHQLRDFPNPEPVWQLRHPELALRFPPLRSPGIIRHNLPRPRARLVGRKDDIDEVLGLLERTGVVSLVGPGGVGKTRLAVEVARRALTRFAAGAWLVELGPLTDEHQVASAIAAVLGIDEQAGRPVLEGVVEHLADREVLVVLDNCEHVIDGVAEVADLLLQRCDRLTVLATSREPLRIRGEAVWRLAPLRAPTEDDGIDVGALAAFEAVELFCDRAALASPGFVLEESNAGPVAAVAGRLDGIPLAIELAAARVGTLGVSNLAGRLEDRFGLLTGGHRGDLPRQQTLRATVDWSHDLLSPPERMLFARLAVFLGTFPLEAAEAVCGGPALSGASVSDLAAALVDKSLVVVDRPEPAGSGGQAGDEARYRMLETIRSYALERLEATGEADERRLAHLRWYLGLATRADRQLHGPDQARWLRGLEADHSNFQAALGWAQAAGGVGDAPAELAVALAGFWSLRGHWSDGRRWLGVAGARSAPGSALRGTARRAEATFAIVQGDFALASGLLDEALGIFRRLGDTRGVASSLQGAGLQAGQQGDHLAANTRLLEALELFREVGDQRGMATCLRDLSRLARRRGAYPDGQRHVEEALALYRELGDLEGVAASLQDLGRLATRRGRDGDARRALTEALGLSQDLGNARGMALCVHGLGLLAMRQADDRAARAHLEEASRLFTDLGDAYSAGFSRRELASLDLRRGDHELARSRLEEVLGVGRRLGGRPLVAAALRGLGDHARSVEDVGRAESRCREALCLATDIGYQPDIAAALEQLAGLACVRGEARRAARMLGAAEAWREAVDAPMSASEQVQHDRDVHAARAGLHDDTFAAAWAEGRAVPIDDAVELALADGPESA